MNPASRLVIGTAGHIDHGKSALVRALTGIEPDRLKEERARGITIDLGFAHTSVDGVQLAFVDVPGHERFVRNMLAGVTGIDAVLLVVAADESVMPQTREHFDICRLLQVPTGVIALTKCDIADEDLRAIARLETRELVAGSFLADAPIVEVSAVTGAGLDALRDALVRQVAATPRRRVSGAMRLPIDRVFTLRGFGTVVTGTLATGTLRTGDIVSVLPSGGTSRIRGLHVHGAGVDVVTAGTRVAANVGDLQVEDLARGDALVTPEAFRATQRIDVRVELLPDVRPLRHGARVRFHQGTTEVMARVALAQGPGPEGGLLGEVPPGGVVHARLRLEAPAVVARGDRFVIRSYSPVTTIGGGLVLDPLPRRAPVRSAAAKVRFDALDPGELAFDAPEAVDRALEAVLVEAGREGMTPADLAVRLGLSNEEVRGSVQRLTRDGRVIEAGEVLLATPAYERVVQQLLDLLDAFHASSPTADGMPREEARDRLRMAPRPFDWLIDRLTAASKVTGRDRLAIPGRRVGPDEEERARIERIETLLSEAALKPPDAGALAAAAGCEVKDVDRAIAWLAREGRVVRVGGLPFHRTALEALKADVRARRAEHDGRLDVALFKARYDVSRKFAIPLLEYLDRERVTRRVGESRVVL
ncbi:MAG TPA: selenocysteine-specific translation elongation factor [Vicinamibacterales bacterium]